MTEYNNKNGNYKNCRYNTQPLKFPELRSSKPHLNNRVSIFEYMII